MRDTTIALALAAICVLAGCTSAPGSTPTASPTDSTAGATTATGTTAAAATTGSPAATGTTQSSTTATSPPTTTSTTSSPTDGDGDSATDGDGDSATDGDGDSATDGAPVDANALAGDAASSLSRTAGVVVEGSLTREIRTPSGSSTVEVEYVERVDAAERELGVERTVSANGQTAETATYLVNGTFYERSPAYERQYGTAWIEVDARDGTWTNASSTAVVSRLVNASTATVASNTTIDGERAVVLDLDVDTSELEALSGFVVDDDTVNALGGTITVDPDTGRVHAATLHVNRTVENSYGQDVTYVTTVTRTFTTYGPVSVTLPDAADDATPINATQG